MILVSVPGCNVPGYQEECWRCLFLAVPDPGGAVQRMLCRKSGTKLAGQKNTKQDRGKKGLEHAPCLLTVRHSTKRNREITHWLAGSEKDAINSEAVKQEVSTRHSGKQVHHGMESSCHHGA